MALLQRLLTFTFQRSNSSSGAPQTFASTGTNTVTVSGVRASVKVLKAGSVTMGTVDALIYGLPPSLMNDLTTLGIKIRFTPRDAITIQAGDAVNGMSTVFAGNITNCYADFEHQPEVPLHVIGHGGLPLGVISAQPTSINGSGDVPTIMSGIANKMGYQFENNGVSGKLNNPYFYGSLKDQAFACAKAGGFNCTLDDNTLAIWPSAGSRSNSGNTPTVSADDGSMVGYPTYTAFGVIVRTLFNRDIKFGAQVQVQSSLQAASGVYTIYGMDHDLDTLVPHGSWFSTLQCWAVKFAPAPPVPQ